GHRCGGDSGHSGGASPARAPRVPRPLRARRRGTRARGEWGAHRAHALFSLGERPEHARRRRSMTAPRGARGGKLSAELAREALGAGIGQVPSRLKPDATTTAICGYCSTGCALTIHLRDGLAVNLSPTEDYPVNLGAACPKGWEALAPLRAADRATTPLTRGPNGRLVPISWPEALETFVERIRGVQGRWGKESVAFLSTGQIHTEEM